MKKKRPFLRKNFLKQKLRMSIFASDLTFPSTLPFSTNLHAINWDQCSTLTTVRKVKCKTGNLINHMVQRAIEYLMTTTYK